MTPDSRDNSATRHYIHKNRDCFSAYLLDSRRRVGLVKFSSTKSKCLYLIRRVRGRIYHAPMQHTRYKGEESMEVPRVPRYAGLSRLASARGHVLCTLTPPPTSSLQTAIRDPPTELRRGSRYLSPSGTLRLWNICDCFRSRWFHRRGSVRRIQ